MNLWSRIILYITSIILVLSPGSTYIEGVSGQPSSFLPSQAETATDKTISSLIYRGLFKYNIFGTLTPDLAEGWEISEDGMIYTITLKENQKWHDGSVISSDDVIYTSFKVPALAGVATDRVDERTVRFTLPNKYSPFLSLLTVGIMKSNSQEESNPLKPISSGQFRVISVSYSGPIVKEVILYNTNEEEDIRKLVFRFYSNEEELEIAASLGEISGFIANNAHTLENFSEQQFPLQGVYYALFFNLDDPALQDLEFRKKLRSAIPMEEVINGKGILVQGPISKSIFTNESTTMDYYDKTLQEEFLGIEFSITVPDLPDHIELAKRVKELWQDKYNLEIEIVRVPPERMVSDVIEKRNYQVLLYGQEVGRDPDRYVYWHSTQTEHPNLNITGLKHVRADRALEEGRNLTDFAERKIHYTVFQEVIEDQVPAIFLYHPYVKYYISDYITGIGEKFTFTLADRFLDFSNWRVISTN